MDKIIYNFVKQKNYPKFELKAVFFDMDGVLFNSMPFHAGAWVKAMKHFKLPFSLYDAYMNEGRTGDSTIDEMFLKKYGFTADSETKQKIYAKKSEFFNQYKIKLKPIPDVLELLKMLKNKGLKLFVVTGSAQVSLFDMLDEHFPNIFEKDRMITAFDVKIGKPHPEPYLMALKRAAAEPYEALVIENAPLGVRSAVAAGILTIGLNTGILKPEELLKEGADVVLPNMKAVIEMLR